ncbi:MAG TPA: HRDC domain-containing protein [Candidatus Polarisedimenticolia bacterium]|jgi:ribonuclease D|nr:HRDC domain-containing protein [Candidatus Polarisedimenticolia bacterium]
MSAPQPPTWVDTEQGLAAAAAKLAKAGDLAVDTEADSFYHYFHKCCLIQVSDGHESWLIDSIALKDLTPLAPVFQGAPSSKVLHAAEQDVLYLRRDFGLEVRPLFDTMIAAQILGKKSVGLAGLLQEYFAVTLDKGCQRDDWSRRPLTERQRAYAAEDVMHLIRLQHVLEADLRERGRLEWAREEFEHIARRSWPPRSFDPDDFWGIKGARDLEPAAAAALKELAAMRDERARNADVPPFRIVSDETLLALARRLPKAAADLDGLKGFTPLVRRRIGPLVLEAVERALAIPEGERPKPPKGQGRRRTTAFRVRVERLRAWRRERAAELGLDPGVLFPQSTLDALADRGMAALDGGDPIPGLRRWRRAILDPDATRLLA